MPSELPRPEQVVEAIQVHYGYRRAPFATAHGLVFDSDQRNIAYFTTDEGAEEACWKFARHLLHHAALGEQPALAALTALSLSTAHHPDRAA